MKVEPIEVKVGQIWEDCDKRMAGRRLKVVRIEDGYAICSVNLSSTRVTSIRLDRMRPTATGFRLVQP